MVKAGDIVKVKVLEVDVARKRIALTRRLDDSPAPARHAHKPEGEGQGNAARRDGGRGGPPRNARPANTAPSANNALAEAFARASRN